MSRLDVALQDVQEQQVAPEGLYDLIVDKAELIEKEGKVMIKTIILFDGMPDYQSIFHYISLPTGDDDAR